MDASGKRKPETNHAFLLEDEEELGKRIGFVNKKETIRANQLDSLEMAVLSVFEYFIGNTDWSVPYQHNIKIYQKADESPIPIAYDFDHSGLVNAGYAHPSEILELSSVRERLYRGPVFSDETFKAVFEKFKEIKPQVYSLYNENSFLSPKYVKFAISYFDEFYEIIDDEKLVKKEFIEKGSISVKQNVQIKGLK